MDPTTDLLAGVRGAVLDADDPSYDTARAVYNAMIDRRPETIVRCADAADVVAVVDYARQTGTPLSVRGGGHNAVGLGVCDGGVVADLSPMRGVRVDPHARTVRVGGGATWGDVDHATHAFGLAVPTGVIASTGVGGLTLGGGHGYFTRKLGLTIDSLLEADVVLADGSLVTASADENADLFWALRGGGGNFGAVTSFLFRGHPIATVHAGPMLWEVEDAADVLRWYREWLPAAPRDAYAFFAFLEVPPGPPFPEALHGKTMCGLVWCHTGTRAEVQEALQAARDVRPPAFEAVGEMPVPALNSMFDPLYPPGLQWYWKGDFVKSIPDEAVRRHVEHGPKLPTMHSTMHLYPVDGAVHDVGQNETAFAYRDAVWSTVYVGVDPDPRKREPITAWARDYWEALHGFSMGGSYVNFLMDEGEDRVRATYRGNHERLAAIKAAVDPGNLFSSTQNIRPERRVVS